MLSKSIGQQLVTGAWMKNKKNVEEEYVQEAPDIYIHFKI